MKSGSCVLASLLVVIALVGCASGGQPKATPNAKTADAESAQAVNGAATSAALPPPIAAAAPTTTSSATKPVIAGTTPAPTSATSPVKAQDALDEFALVDKLLEKGTETAQVIQEHIDKGLKNLRDKNNLSVQKKREDFARDERRKRDEFENGLKKKRAEYLKKKADADDRKEFAIEQGEERKEFLLEQADVRKEFEEEMRETRKTLEGEVQETKATYAKELNAYAKTHKTKH